MVKLQGSYVLEIDFCDPECTLVCVISESISLMVGRAMRYLVRTDSTILQHFVWLFTSAKSFVKVIASAKAPSLNVALRSVNGNLG